MKKIMYASAVGGEGERSGGKSCMQANNINRLFGDSKIVLKFEFEFDTSKKLTENGERTDCSHKKAGGGLKGVKYE
jgi:hypothetical protein